MLPLSSSLKLSSSLQHKVALPLLLPRYVDNEFPTLYLITIFTPLNCCLNLLYNIQFRPSKRKLLFEFLFLLSIQADHNSEIQSLEQSSCVGVVYFLLHLKTVVTESHGDQSDAVEKSQLLVVVNCVAGSLLGRVQIGLSKSVVSTVTNTATIPRLARSTLSGTPQGLLKSSGVTIKGSSLNVSLVHKFKTTHESGSVKTQNSVTRLRRVAEECYKQFYF